MLLLTETIDEVELFYSQVSCNFHSIFTSRKYNYRENIIDIFKLHTK